MDASLRKEVLRKFTYGLYILTAEHAGQAAAATVTWLSQASFEPPLLMVAVKTGSSVHAVIEKAGAFAVHVVGADQQEIAAAFFQPAEMGNGSLSGYSYVPGDATGAPLLIDLPAWVEAQVVERVVKGDHTVLVAEIVNLGMRNPDMVALALRDTPWKYSR